MSIDTAFRRLQEANPVPRPDDLPVDVPDLSVLLAMTAQRSMEMQTQQDSRARSNARRPQRKWSFALAAGLAVIAIGVLWVLIPAEDRQDVAGTAPAELVETWVALYEAGDVDGFHALMSEDTIWSCEGALACEAPPEKYFDGTFGADLWDARESRRIYAAQGTLNASCSGGGATVTCEFSKMDVFRSEPTEYTYVFDVEDGEIIEITLLADERINASEGHREIRAYELWVDTNYPDETGELFYLGTMLLETDDQVERHRELIAEWTSS